MTRGKSSAQAATGLHGVQAPPKKAAGGSNKAAGDKLSREALSLLNSALVMSTNTGHDAVLVGRTRGRASVPGGAVKDADAGSEQHLPVIRGKKGLSAPPAPDGLHGTQRMQQEQVAPDAGAGPSKPEAKKGASSKRAAPVEAKHEDVEVPKQQGNKKRKVGRSTEQEEEERQEGAAAATTGPPAGSKGAGSALDGVGAVTSTAAAANGKQKRQSKSNDKARIDDQTAAVASFQAPPFGPDRSHDGLAAANGSQVESQPAAGSGAAKQARNAKKQQVAPAAIPATKPAQLDPSPSFAVAQAQAADTSAAADADEAGAGPSNASTTGKAPSPAAGVQVAAANGRRSKQQQKQHHDQQVLAPASGQAGGAAEAAAASGVAAKAAPPAAAPVPAQPPVMAAPQPAAGGAKPAVPTAAAPAATAAAAAPAAAPATGTSGAGGSASSGSEGRIAGAVAAVAAAAGRPLPVTGSTPVKAFVPVPMPRMDEVGQRERSAVVELQRQLSELRGMYDELKATKIQELEKVLAEQVEYTEEQVQHVEQRARLWQAAAEHAEQKAKTAGSQEVANRIAELEAQVEQLLREKGELLLRVAAQQREMATTQQAVHDLRAEVMVMQQQDPSGGTIDGEGEEEDGREEEDGDVEAGSGEGMEVEQRASEEAGEGDGDAAVDVQDLDAPGVGGQGPSPSLARRGGATPTALTNPAAKAGRGVGMQFPTPSPGVGVQFPTPGAQLVRLQVPQSGGAPSLLLSGGTPSGGWPGVSTECLRIVQMLPTLRGGSAQGGGTSAPGSDSRTGGPGINTECQRVLQMLPSLRAPTPSIQSRLASGAVPLALQTEAARTLCDVQRSVDATTGAGGGGGAEGQAAAQQTGNKSRRSTGSPIDGICGAGQRKTGAAGLAADVSFARSLGAPEAFLVGAPQQDRYSFVDLNPASARKGERPALVTDAAAAAASDEQAPEPGPGPAGLCAAALMAAAAATALPPSPTASSQGPRQQPVAMAPAGSGALVGRTPTAARRGLGSPAPQLLRSPSGRPQVPAADMTGLSPRSAAAAAALINSGSNLSNQDSCSGLVARAMAQQQQQLPAPGVPGVQAYGNRTPVSASKRTARSPARLPTATGDGDAPPLLSPAAGPATAAAAEGNTSPAPQQQQPLPCSPSPRAAKLIMYERMLDWHVDTVSLKPETCRLTHRACGVSFELREAELDDEEAEALAEEGTAAGAAGAGTADGADDEAGPRPTCFVYTPLELGSAGDSLPAFLKETIQIAAHQRRELLDLLNKAIKASLSKKAKA